MSRITDHPIDLAALAVPVGEGQIALSHREGPLVVEIDIERGVIMADQNIKALPPTHSGAYNAALAQKLHQFLTLPIGVIYKLSFLSPYTPHHDLYSSLQSLLGPRLPSAISIDPLIHTATATVALSLKPSAPAQAVRPWSMRNYASVRVPAKPAEQQKSVTDYCELLFVRCPSPIHELITVFSRPMTVLRYLENNLTNLESLVAKPHSNLQRGHYVALAAIYRSHFEAQLATSPAPVRSLRFITDTRIRFNAFRNAHT